MKRRNFILLSSITPLLLNAATLDKPFVDERYVTLSEVLDALFPKTKTMPSAKEFGAIEYLISNINHPTFPKEDKDFLLQGAVDFKSAFPEFFTLKNKVEFLNSAQENEYAQDWLSKVIYYGIEAMLSDPIYGGNKNQIGWQAIEHKIGKPQPKKKYGQKI